MTSLFVDGDHIGIVTRNLDRSLRTWVDGYGVGPWHVFEYRGEQMIATYCGEEKAFPMRAALTTLGGGFRLEVIQPLVEAGPYHDSLVAHGDADHLHHVRLAERDPAQVEARLAARGHTVVLDAAFSGVDPTAPDFGARYWSTTAELGFLLEVARRPVGFSMPEPVLIYEPAANSSTSAASTET